MLEAGATIASGAVSPAAASAGVAPAFTIMPSLISKSSVVLFEIQVFRFESGQREKRGCSVCRRGAERGTVRGQCAARAKEGWGGADECVVADQW